MSLDSELSALATQQDLPSAMVWRLLRHPAARRSAAVLRRDLSEEQMEQIIALGSARSLAANGSVPAWLKARLAEDPEPSVRAAAASNATDEPTGLLARLAGDPDPLVRWFLTMNDHLPTELVTRLAEDPDSNVRAELPRYRRDAPEAVQRALFTDPEPRVRQAALAFWSPPADLLPGLLADPLTRVAAARHAPEFAATAAADDPAEVHTCPPRSPAPPALTLEQAEALLIRAGL